MSSATIDHPRLIRLPEVRKITGLSRTAIYGLLATGKFPASIQLTARAVAWVEDEVRGWIVARIAARVG